MQCFASAFPSSVPNRSIHSQTINIPEVKENTINIVIPQLALHFIAALFVTVELPLPELEEEGVAVAVDFAEVVFEELELELVLPPRPMPTPGAPVLPVPVGEGGSCVAAAGVGLAKVIEKDSADSEAASESVAYTEKMVVVVTSVNVET
jgi:hypothetical protein